MVSCLFVDVCCCVFDSIMILFCSVWFIINGCLYCFDICGCLGFRCLLWLCYLIWLLLVVDYLAVVGGCLWLIYLVGYCDFVLLAYWLFVWLLIFCLFGLRLLLFGISVGLLFGFGRLLRLCCFNNLLVSFAVDLFWCMVSRLMFGFTCWFDLPVVGLKVDFWLWLLVVLFCLVWVWCCLGFPGGCFGVVALLVFIVLVMYLVVDADFSV